MKLDTLRFGEIDIDEGKIFESKLPIIGFDTHKCFAIIEPNKESIFKWLQSIEDPALAFPIISVTMLDYDYSIDVSDNVLETLDIKDVEDVLVMNITSIPQDDPEATTINLLAPLLFNVKNGLAGQIILSGSGYEISYPMFKKG